MKTLKSIDGKSLLIGGLLACTIFFAMGATGPKEKWDDEQQWETAKVGKVVPPSLVIDNKLWVLVRKVEGKDSYTRYAEWPKGWEPVGLGPNPAYWIVRKRIK